MSIHSTGNSNDHGMPGGPPIRLITYATACAQAGISKHTLQRMIRAGAITPVQLNAWVNDPSRAARRIVEHEWQALIAARMAGR